MRIFITGINGFVGSHLADWCTDVVGLVRDINHKTKPTKATIIRGDILDLELLKRIISDYEISLVYHLAAQSIVRIANTNPANTFASNVTGTINVLEAVRQVNPSTKVVMASSDKAYGAHEILPYTEDMKLQPDDPYATSKACADLIGQAYAKTYGLNVNIIRCANIYGPGDMNLSRLIPNSITRILDKKSPKVYSGVLQYIREFIYIDDVCRAYQLIAEKGKPGEVYNIGSTDFETIETIVRMICTMMKWEAGFEIVEKTFNEIPQQYLSSEKIRRLGWASETGIINGLQKTIDWYVNRHL